MSGRADVVNGLPQVAGDPEHGSGVGPASTRGPSVTMTPWPLSSSLVLGALPSAVGCARLHARNVMCEWGLGSIAETVELVASELTTNAVLASTGPDGRPRYEGDQSGLPVVHVRLMSDCVHLVIEVWDRSMRAPIPKQAEPDREGGRGLMLVEALCERWNWRTVAGWSGKLVWAELRVT